MVFPFFEMTPGFKPFTVLWYFHCRKNCITASSYNDSLEYLTFLFFKSFVGYQQLEMALTLLGISLDQKDSKACLPLKFTYYDREIMYNCPIFGMNVSRQRKSALTSYLSLVFQPSH